MRTMRQPRSWKAGCSSGSDSVGHTLVLPGTLPVRTSLGQSLLVAAASTHRAEEVACACVCYHSHAGDLLCTPAKAAGHCLVADSSQGCLGQGERRTHKGTSMHAHQDGAEPDRHQAYWSEGASEHKGRRSPSAARMSLSNFRIHRGLLYRIGVVGCLVVIRLPVLQGLPPYAVAVGVVGLGAFQALLDLCWQCLRARTCSTEQEHVKQGGEGGEASVEIVCQTISESAKCSLSQLRG